MVGTSSFMGESKIQNLYFIILPYQKEKVSGNVESLNNLSGQYLGHYKFKNINPFLPGVVRNLIE